MNDTTIKAKADYAPNEKKVWRPESAVPMSTPVGMQEGIYFLAIEELQGAWIDGEWEEADSSEAWTETYTDTFIDSDGHTVTRVTKKDFTKDIPRSRRYVLKRFGNNGSVENAYSGGFGGPRQYKK